MNPPYLTQQQQQQQQQQSTCYNLQIKEQANLLHIQCPMRSRSEIRLQTGVNNCVTAKPLGDVQCSQ
jgi:hypothetical protein